MATTPFSELTVADGSWDALRASWQAQCEKYDEEIDSYAPATMGELATLAATSHPRAGVFALANGDQFDAVCQANCVMLPGYDGPVLRIRFMTLSPDYDFGTHEIIDYGRVLIAMLLATIQLSTKRMKARHIKLHLRSPADQQFFAAVGSGLNGSSHFAEVAMKGTWLHITKKA